MLHSIKSKKWEWGIILAEFYAESYAQNDPFMLMKRCSTFSQSKQSEKVLVFCGVVPLPDCGITTWGDVLVIHLFLSYFLHFVVVTI